MSAALRAGVLLAVASAIAFGATTPVVAWAGRDLGPLATAALLYAGAAGAALLLRVARRAAEPPLRRADAARVVLVAVCGGAIAPTLLAWGLQRTGATVGALLLNLEAVFTVLLARAVFGEAIGRRVAVAVTAMALGGAALVLARATAATWAPAGIAAVVAATAAWALDNTLTRPLSERDPLHVIAAKGLVGAALTAALALARGEPRPTLTAAGALLACGAIGYGASLRCYLLAQRRIGAARTGSVFALAPFIGATAAAVVGHEVPGAWTLAAAALFAGGVYLHVTERPAAWHDHPAIEHEHLHAHDDGHHDHVHDPPVVGAHRHPHAHAAHAHAHPGARPHDHHH